MGSVGEKMRSRRQEGNAWDKIIAQIVPLLPTEQRVLQVRKSFETYLTVSTGWRRM
jgi:hypothetical protein